MGNLTRIKASLRAHVSILLLAAAAVLPEKVHAQLSIVVAKESGLKPSLEEIKQIFSAYMLSSSDGKAIHVVDQPDTESGTVFYDKVLKRKTRQVWMEWTRLVLSGQAQSPEKVKSDLAVKRAVLANPRAIGYIATASLDSSVVEIARIP